MRTIKNKGSRSTRLSTDEIISSVIVPFREKLRPCKRAKCIFSNRTFFLSLYPNVNCSISELPTTARRLSDLFRAIINKDAKYEQSKNNLPSFVGIRDIMSHVVGNVNIEDVKEFEVPMLSAVPYIRVELENIQGAAFILRQWCSRTAQFPTEFVLWYNINGKPSKEIIRQNKSNPFMLEYYARRKGVEVITFGAVATLSFVEGTQSDDLHAIPSVRVSQSFGKQRNIYTIRAAFRMAERREAAELERCRNERNKALQRLQARTIRHKQLASFIGGAPYNRYIYKGAVPSATAYEAARDRTLKTETRYSVELSAYKSMPSVAVSPPISTSKSVEVEEEKQQSVKQIASIRRINKKRIKEALLSGGHREAEVKLEQIDVDAVVASIYEAFEVEVDRVTGQCSIKF